VSPVFAIAAKDLRQRLRDRSALVLGFVAPLAIAALMSAAFSNADRFHVDLGFASADRGQVASALHDLLTGPRLRSTFTVKEYADATAARRAVRDHDVGASVVVPAGFSAAVTSAHSAQVQVIGGVDTQVAADIARAVVNSFVARVKADRLAVAAAIVSGRPTAQAATLAHRAATMPLPVAITQHDATDRQLEPISYYAPSMGIFFVLFATGFGARGWFLERAGGTLDRMAAAPLRTRTLLLGKALATFGYALASLATTITVSALAFGARWGNPFAVAVLCVAIAASVVALTMLVMAVARTERQGDGLASILTFALVLAGGNFVLSTISPDALRSLALWTPNGWALRGFSDLATGATATSTIVDPVLGIAAFTVVVLALTAIASRRMVQR
jgi:ABC-2 type transport system permease protein